MIASQTSLLTLDFYIHLSREVEWVMTASLPTSAANSSVTVPIYSPYSDIHTFYIWVGIGITFALSIINLTILIVTIACRRNYCNSNIVSTSTTAERNYSTLSFVRRGSMRHSKSLEIPTGETLVVPNIHVTKDNPSFTPEWDPIYWL